MPKYQIILESSEQIPSDEFREAVESGVIDRTVFKVLEARNLQGIREEVWKQDVCVAALGQTVKMIHRKPNDISDLL